MKKIYKNAKNINQPTLKIALCTMGKKENLYSKEFINYYFRLGVDHIFIYDDNPSNSEKISVTIENRFRNFVSIYNTSEKNLKRQFEFFTDCYTNNKYKFDWFLMFDMDEYLFVVNDTLVNYLSRQIFDKCDIINFHWMIPTDNNLVNYDNRSLFERFKGPYIKSEFIKSIIRGNITNLKYAVHSPGFSPERNYTCNNEGEKINFTNYLYPKVYPINIKNAYIIHFRYKSTEEFINKYKRGYSNWKGKKINVFLKGLIKEYFQFNNATKEKINLIERRLNISLKEYKKIYFF